MSALTVLGASGGVGTTTLTALAIAGLQGAGVGSPRLEAADPAALEARLALPSDAPTNHAVLVRDGGSATASAILEALGHGAVTVASAATPLGEAALDAVFDALGTRARGAQHPLLVVRTGAHGGHELRIGPVPAAAVTVRLPFDRALATPGRITLQRERYRAPTRLAIDAWTALARSALTGAPLEG